MKRLLLACLFLAGVASISQAQVASQVPPGGLVFAGSSGCRMYVDPATGSVTAKNAAGSACLSAGSLHGTGAPSNPCAAGTLYTDDSTGNFYSCDSGTWTLGTGTGGPPSGSAGGSLSGTYPNPGVANNAVTTATINALAVTTAKIAANAVTSTKVDSSVCATGACSQNTTGTASNLSGTPALPSGTTATTQSPGDNTTDVATDAFVLANGGTLPTGSGNEVLATPANGSSAQAALRVLVSADIPNNAANTSGTAANLSGTPTVPNGTAAATQAVTDASTKLANDAYVQGQKVLAPGGALTVGTLPGSPVVGEIATVSDGASGNDCTAGGGSTVVTCRYNSGAWAALVSAGGATIASTTHFIRGDNAGNGIAANMGQNGDGTLVPIAASLSYVAQTVTPSSGAANIDWTKGNDANVAALTQSTTLTFTVNPTSNTRVRIRIPQGSTAYTITFGASSGSIVGTPILNDTVSAQNMVYFDYDAASTTYYAINNTAPGASHGNSPEVAAPGGAAPAGAEDNWFDSTAHAPCSYEPGSTTEHCSPKTNSAGVVQVAALPTTTVAQKFFGTAAPGSVAGNLPGDFFSDTTNHNDYWCNAASGTAAPACTSVAAGGWTLLNSGTATPGYIWNYVVKSSNYNIADSDFSSTSGFGNWLVDVSGLSNVTYTLPVTSSGLAIGQCIRALNLNSIHTLTINVTTNSVGLNGNSAVNPVLAAQNGMEICVADTVSNYVTKDLGPDSINSQSGNYTATDADINRLIVMNCSGACAVTLPASPSVRFRTQVLSVGSTLATVGLSSLNFNGGASAPVLNSYRVWSVWSDGTNYFGEAPLVAGSNITITPAANGVTVAASGGGSGGGVISYSSLAATWVTGDFISPGGGNTQSATEANVQMAAAGSATISNLNVQLGAALVSGTMVVTYRSCTPTSGACTGTNRALTCSITGSAVGCSDTTHSFTPAAGDLVSVGFSGTFVSSSTPLMVQAAWGTSNVGVTNVTGTPNQIDVATGTTTPVVSLDSSLIFPGTASMLAAGGQTFTVSSENSTLPDTLTNRPCAPVTNSSANTDKLTLTTTNQYFTGTCEILASSITAGKRFQLTVMMTVTQGATRAQFQPTIDLCTASPSGSSCTGAVHIATTAATVSYGIASKTYSFTSRLYCYGTAAAGSSTTIVCNPSEDSASSANQFMGGVLIEGTGITASVPTNGNLWIGLGLKDAGSNSNTASLLGFFVDWDR